MWITDTTSQRQRKQYRIYILCRPPVPQSVTQVGSFVQRSHMSPSRPETSSTGASGNKETRCHKQWTINPWSGRKQLGSKSNFSPFCLVLGGEGDWGLWMWLLYLQDLTSTLIIQYLSAVLDQLLYKNLLWELCTDVNSCILHMEEHDQVQDQTCVIGQTTTLCTLLQKHTGVYKLFTERGLVLKVIQKCGAITLKHTTATYSM